MGTMPGDKRKRLYCGIEGGSTKTIAVVIDDDENPVRRIQTGPCNIKLLDDVQLIRLWKGIASRLKFEPPFIGMFLAGCVSPSDEARVKRVAQEVWPSAKVTV